MENLSIINSKEPKIIKDESLYILLNAEDYRDYFAIRFNIYLYNN